MFFDSIRGPNIGANRAIWFWNPTIAAVQVTVRNSAISVSETAAAVRPMMLLPGRNTWWIRAWPIRNGWVSAAGFHLSSLYSPVGWFSWADAAVMFEEAQRSLAPSLRLEHAGD
jgi:hypothetical protein